MIRFKCYVTGRMEWEVPARRTEENETPEEVAARECREETGCNLHLLKPMGRFNPANISQT